VAVRRQRLRPEDKPVRAAVEATIRSVKHVFPGGKLPVRGLARATMMICASAMMANLRRIHRYRRENALRDFFAPLIRALHHLSASIANMWRAIGIGRRTGHKELAMSCRTMH
jgi:hypothetical protein